MGEQAAKDLGGWLPAPAGAGGCHERSPQQLGFGAVVAVLISDELAALVASVYPAPP